MKTLQQRMDELIAATGWSVGEIAKIAGVSSAAVSQWVGHGEGKKSNKIGKLEAAIKIEQKSGFSALWLAEGKGPKMAAQEAPRDEDPAEARIELLPQALTVVAQNLAQSDRFARVWPKVSRLLSDVAEEADKFGTFAQQLKPLLPTSQALESAPDNGASSKQITMTVPPQWALLDDKHIPIPSKKTRGK